MLVQATWLMPWHTAAPALLPCLLHSRVVACCSLPIAGNLADASELLDQLHASGLVGSQQLYHGLLQVRHSTAWGGRAASVSSHQCRLQLHAWQRSSTTPEHAIAPAALRPQACQAAGRWQLALEIFLGMQVGGEEQAPGAVPQCPLSCYDG